MNDLALDLMQAADALTGVEPGMSPASIARLQDVPRERLEATYLTGRYRAARTSHERGECREALTTLVGQFPHLRTLVNKALAGGISITVKRGAGRPRKHADDLIARRAASRAYRERRRKTDGA